MADEWQRSQRIGRRLSWWHPSVTSGTVYPQLAVVKYRKMLCRMGKIHRPPARPHFPVISYHRQGRVRVYNSCVKSAMFNANETWDPTISDPHRLQRNDRDMVGRGYGVTTKGQVSSQDLLERMLLENLAKVFRTYRLRWHGHVELSDGRLKKIQKRNPTGGRGPARPKKPWKEVIGMDCLPLGLTETHPSDRNAWSGRLRSSCQTGPTLILGIN